MKIGYVRVSSKEQNTERQVRALQEITERLYIDKLSGKDTNRPQLQEMLEYVREGDTIIVESISRFARNTKDLLELIEMLEKKSVKFISQKEAIDTSTATGRFMITIFGAVAQLERDYIKQRQKEGIEIAKEKNILGRPKLKNDKFEEVYNDWKTGNITAIAGMELLEMKRNTFYRRVKEYESANK